MTAFPLDSEDMRTPPQTEDSAERGHTDLTPDGTDPVTYDDLGQSGELHSEDGDIADEGAGHRG